MDSLAAIPSPLRINLVQYLSGDSDSVYVSFDVVAVDTIIYDVTPILYLAVVENSHTYPAGTGRYSFRDMLPDGDGEIIAIQKGDSLHFDWAYPVSPVYTLRELLTTVMVQNRIDPAIPGKQRNKILQAASAWVLDRASVAGGGTQPQARIWLGQNAPNPFTSGTTIAYNLSDAGKVRMSVYTPTGRLVTQLVDGYFEPGSHYATWNGCDRFGKEVGSGVYYYLLNSEKGSRTGRMVLLK